MDKFEILKQIFGYDTFREGQEELVDSSLSGRDVLGIMPTGAGKSICFQVPALLFPGITIVVSPLISLMKDQVSALNAAGVHAAYINSSLTEGQYRKAMELARQGRYKIIYAAPERLMTDSFLSLIQAVEISMVAVDEAHCISQWGQDFRPSYLKIVDFISALPKRPVIGAYTATATKAVREDILCILGLRDPKIMVTGYDRKNLYFAVEKPKDKTRKSTKPFWGKGIRRYGITQAFPIRRRRKTRRTLSMTENPLWWLLMPLAWELTSLMSGLSSTIICQKILKATIRKQAVQDGTESLESVSFTTRLRM